jgi:cyclophilin family peptidyl-prolyl cis-trans isomerase
VRRLAVIVSLAAALAAWPAATASGASGPGCAAAKRPKPRAQGTLKAPTTRLDRSKHWTLTFHTSCGVFVVLLDPKASPRATASLVALARRHFFDGTIFHRIVPGFVVQGGDPTQSGSGGPGYTTVDTPRPGTRYAKNVVAMAKTQTEPPGTAGSQFFVMTAAASLPPDYAVVGRVVSGIPVVDRIGKLGDASDPLGTPTRVVVVQRVTVRAR